VFLLRVSPSFLILFNSSWAAALLALASSKVSSPKKII